MPQPDLDVVGIGNAIGDVISHAEDEFLDAHALPKGGMTLIDDDQANRLYASMGPGIENSLWGSTKDRFLIIISGSKRSYWRVGTGLPPTPTV